MWIISEKLLTPLVLKAAASGADTGIHAKNFDWMTTLVTFNKGVEDIMNKVKCLE